MITIALLSMKCLDVRFFPSAATPLLAQQCFLNDVLVIAPHG